MVRKNAPDKLKHLHAKQIFAFTKGKDTCNGDSGGPLVIVNGNVNVLIGVTSIGPEQCGSQLEEDLNKLYPGVYTDVREFYHWIQSRVDEDLDEDVQEHIATEKEKVSGSSSSNRGHSTIGSNTDMS